MKPSIYIVFYLVLCSICLFFQLIELALGLLAVIPLFLLVYLSILDKTIELRLLSIAYMIGQFTCWVVGFLGCFYILPSLGYQIGKHTITTMILINLVMWASLIGSVLTLRFKLQKKESLFQPLSDKVTRTGVLITGIIFIICTVFNLLLGSFDARFLTGGSISTDSPLYFLSGISSIQYIFFFFLGTRLQAPLSSNKNFFPLLFIALSVIVFSFAGGREPIVRFVLFFFIGSIYGGKIKSAILRNILLFLIQFLLTFTIVLGYARADQNFSNGDFSARLSTISQVMLGKVQFQGNNYDDPVFGLLTRITEPTGQLVIDGVVDNPTYIGFKNFERITSIFIPKVITGEKLPSDDGAERLKDDYGVNITQFTSAPITFMADSFERGGYLVVFFASLVLSSWLTYVGRLLNLLKRPAFKSALLCSLSFVCLRLYTPSILGTISIVTYSFLRDFILFWLLFRLIKARIKSVSKGQIEN